MSGADRVTNWLVSSALPLWADAGVDREGGGFVERLFLDGAPDFAAAKRVRVQARQIYVFAHAHLLGLRPEGAELALRGFEFVRRHARHDDRTFAHLLDRSGRIVDDKRDTYDHAFLLLAFAWLFRATGSNEVKRTIDETLEAVDKMLLHSSGQGYREDDRDSLPRRQNPHMHLLEAFLALYEATGERTFLSRADAIVDLFRRCFFDARLGVLREFFTDDWKPASGDMGRVIEPGHHYEWVWLLQRQSCLAETAPLSEIKSLAAFADSKGCEAKTGLAFDEVWEDGRVKSMTKRSWPQTEALKAELALSELAGQGITPRADALLGNLFHYYLDRNVAGGWNDVVDGANLPVATHIPASTLYHVFLAFTEYLRVANAHCTSPGGQA